MRSNNDGVVNIQIIQAIHDVKVVIGDVQRRPKYADVPIEPCDIGFADNNVTSWHSVIKLCVSRLQRLGIAIELRRRRTSG